MRRFLLALCIQTGTDSHLPVSLTLFSSSFFPPQVGRDLRSSGMLRSVDCQLTTFQDELSVPSSRVKKSMKKSPKPVDV